MNGFFVAAAMAALITCAVHTFVGGRLFARPLLASTELRPVVRLTLYYCWHIVTVMLAVMSVAFLYAATTPAHLGVASTFTALALACAFLSLGLVLWHRVNPFRMPQWLFFATIGTLGILGHLY